MKYEEFKTVSISQFKTKLNIYYNCYPIKKIELLCDCIKYFSITILVSGYPTYELFNNVEGFLFYENSKYVIDLGEYSKKLQINITFENLIEKLKYICYYDVELYAKK